MTVAEHISAERRPHDPLNLPALTRTDLQSLLFRLKQDHVQSHPELLSVGARGTW